MMSQSKHEDLSKLLENIVRQAKDYYLYGSVKPPVVESVPTIRVLFKEIYDCHKKDGYYWEYCHIDVYKDTFKSRFAAYKKEHDNVPDILDFVNSELEYLDNLFAYDIIGLDTVSGYECSNSDEKHLSLHGFSLDCLFGKDDPTFLKTIIMSNTHKFKLLNNIKDMNSDKERMDSLDILLATKKRIRTIDPLDEPSKLRLIEHGVLKEEQDGTFNYIDGFYDQIFKEATAYVDTQAHFLASDIWDNKFINFDPLPIKSKLNILNQEIENQFTIVNHPLASDPLNDFEADLERLLNFKNVLYLYIGVQHTEGIDDFQNHISIIGNKLYYDRLIDEITNLEAANIDNQPKDNKSGSLTTTDGSLKKKGKPKTKIKLAREFIKNIDLKDKLLESLKPFFKDCTAKKATHVIITLKDLGWLDLENKNAVYLSFSNYYGQIFGNRSNFYKHLSSVDTKLISQIKSDIIKLKEDKTII